MGDVAGTILVIETATPACSVALVEGDEVLRSASVAVGRGHAERLLPMIAALLDGERPRAIAVDCGPGSFTGVRVGVAAAKAFGLGWGVPVTGFSSLALIAAGAGGGADRLAVAIPGGHGELFVGRFAGCPLASAGPIQSLIPEVAADRIADPLVIGAGAAALIAARGWGEARDALPDAADYVRLAVAERALPPRPTYGRAPDARPTVGQA